ncbi:MAG TPA: aromatic-ring-hydroxylating dioxygenase subunit beta [Thermoleophilaceae bacterium]|jgi:3-phenylpropionate/cinnamic acid dioxygenase small subunit
MSEEAVRLPFADEQTHNRLRLFLDREAELLDGREYRDWLDLVDEEFTYRMPVPITPDNPAAPHYDAGGLIIDETRETLAEHWFRRLEPDMWEMAWAEVPPVRFRHFITNVRVRVRDDGAFEVRSNALVTATRQSDQSNILAVERFDVVEDRDAGPCLLSRFVVPETTVLAFAQLRVVL